MYSFKTKRLVRSYTLKFMASPDLVFPLLCPEREREWIPGWEYEMIYSDSGLIEEGCVFKTPNTYGAETIWTVVKYDQTNYEIVFVKYCKDMLVEEMHICLKKQDGNGNTNATVKYTYTPFTEKGNQFIENFTEENFINQMSVLEKYMNQFLLNTGSALGIR